MRSLINTIILFCGLVVTSANATSTTNEQSLDRIVAVVNDSLITQTELNNAVNSIKKQIAMDSSITLPNDKTLKKQVLQQLIDRKLQLQLAELAGVQVKDDQLDTALNRIAESNNMTLAQLYQQLPQQGLNVEEYRKQIREEILIQQVEQHEIGSKITITPQEVSDFKRSKAWQTATNKEYHLEDILISVPDSPTPEQLQEAKKRADEVLRKLRHGTDFHSAALAESSGEKALEGGDLGWRKFAEIPSVFTEHVSHMQKNDIAGPIQAPNGYHIIKLADLRVAEGQNNSDQQIERLIFQRKMDEAIPSWLAKIRSQAFINTHPEG